ncbi:MAG: hypothetical protein E5V90_20780 [Mesorhizobium sp.]|nr:MAG: hypothetical protein E5V90_20780 [Mesorhizobium sp.]
MALLRYIKTEGRLKWLPQIEREHMGNETMLDDDDAAARGPALEHQPAFELAGAPSRPRLDRPLAQEPHSPFLRYWRCFSTSTSAWRDATFWMANGISFVSTNE